MTTDKRISNEYNGSNFVDPDSGLRYAKRYNPANPGDAVRTPANTCHCHHPEGAHDSEGACAACECERYSEVTSPSPDASDEMTGRLLAAIEQAISELESGMPFSASVTLYMVLQEYRGHLATLTPPQHLSTLWENDPENGE